jgi:hypothetical protein
MNDLHLTEGYTNLRIALQDKSRALLEILYHKSAITTLLLEHLHQDPEPVLQLLVALSQDLLDEFYPLFDQVLRKIVQLVLSKPTPEILERTFQSMTYMIQNLNRWITEDTFKVINSLEELLNHEQIYICKLTATCVSPLLRKMTRPLCEKILGSSICEKSVSLMFFEMLKNADGFHSKTPTLLEMVIDTSFSVIEDCNMCIETMLEYLFVLMGHHGTANSLREYWILLFGYYRKYENQKEKEIIIKLVYIWTTLRKSTRISDRQLLHQFISESLDESVNRNTMRVACVFLEEAAFPEWVASRQIVEKILQVMSDSLKSNHEIAISFFSYLIPSGHFGQFLFSRCIEFCNQNWSMQTLRLLADIVQHPGYRDFFKLAQSSVKEGQLLRGSNIVADLTSRLHAVDFTSADQEEFTNTVGFVHLAVETLNQFMFPYSQGREIIDSLYEKMRLLVNVRSAIHTLAVEGDRSLMIQGLMGILLKFFVSIAKSNNRVDELEGFWDKSIELLSSCKENLGFLSTYFNFVETLPNQANAKEFPRVFGILKENIGSYSSRVRIQSLKVLQLFTLSDFVVQKDSVFHGRITVLKIDLGIRNLH